MKNRLQFNRIPTVFSGATETRGGEQVWVSGREQAAEALDNYIKRGSFIPLIGEPIVLRYTDDKGDRQAMLAIGKSTGATIDMVGDRKYHIIDSAALQEGVDQANENAEQALELASAATKDTADYLTILKNMILSGIGLTDGTYFDNNGRWDRDPSGVGLYDPEKVDETFYLKNATSFLDADKKLDAALVATNAWFNGRCDNLQSEIDKEHGYRKAIAIKEIDQQYYSRLGLGDDIKAAYFLTTHKPGDGNFDQYDYPQNGEVIIKVYKDEVSREEFENVLAAEGLNEDGTYDHERAHNSINFKDAFDAFTADELLDQAIASLSANTMAANNELNDNLSELSAATVAIETKEENIITAAGLNPDGTFNHTHESNYMSASNSLVENDMLLDATIAELSANTMAADQGLSMAIAGTNAMLNGRCDMLQTQIDEEKTYRKSIKLRKLTPAQIEQLELGDNVLAAYDLVDHHNYAPTTAETIVKVYKDNINTLDLDYQPEENKIVLSWNDGLEDRSTSIDVSDFVKDSFLTGVEVVVSGGVKYMKFAFKTYDDKPLPIYVPIEDFAVLYDVLPESYNYLTVDNDVYKIGAKVDVEHGLAGYDTLKFISGLTENIISGAGLNLLNPGAYPGHDETHYIKDAGSLDQADVILDAAIYGVSGNVGELSGSVVTNQTIINNILAGTGLNTEEPGEYHGHDHTYFISAATSLDNADVLLDAAIWETSGLVADISDRVDALSGVVESFSAHTVEALSALSASVDERIESGLTFISGVVENYVEERLSGLNFDEIYEYIDSGDTALNERIDEVEEVTAAALNDLNRRTNYFETHYTGEYIPITNYTTATGTTEEELMLDGDDSINEAFGKLQKQILDNEEAISAGLNDLNRRVEENTEAIAKNTGVKILSGAVRSFSAATVNQFEEVNNNITNNENNITIVSGALLDLSAMTQGVLTLNVNGFEQGKYSPSASTTIDLEIIQEVTGADVLLTGYELASGSTEEELAVNASDNVNEAFGKVQKQIYDNEAVIAGALNDLNDRINDITASTGGDVSALSASVVTNKNNINVLSGDVSNCFDDAAYITSAKTIVFKHGDVIKCSIDATDFIKDGMVDDVVIDTPTGGTHAGVECLIITFNTDAGKEAIEIPVADIFDPTTLNELSASVVSNRADIDFLSGAMIDNELVIAAAFNDLNSRLNEIEAGMMDPDDYYTKTEVDDITNAIYSAMSQNELVIAAAFNDLNSRLLDVEEGMMDPDDYYTKDETDDKFYNKTEIDNNFYNKTEINNIVKKEFTTGSSVTNLALDKFLTVVTLGSDATLTITQSPSWNLSAGEVIEAHVIINNTGSTGIIVTVGTTDNRLKITGDGEVLVDPSGFGEVNALITYNGSAYTIYIITS